MKTYGFYFILLLVMISCKNESGTENVEKIENEKNLERKLEEESISPVFPDELEQERTDWQNPDIVLNALGDISEKTVVDIGAGAGYFSFKLARIAEKVIALDIDPNALDYINEQKEIVGNWANNIEARLTPPDVPNLLPDEVHSVLVVNTFSFIPDQENYFSRLKESMKTDAVLLIVDFKKGNIPVGPSDERKLEANEVKSILRKAGYRKISIDEKSLEYQYIIKAYNN